MNVILLGAPGAGKGTQAAELSQKLSLAHIASGDLFRQAQSSGTELGNVVKSYMEKGQLVPDDITVKMVLERISQPDCASGFILDGFPRNLEQARALENALKDKGQEIDKAVYIKVPEEELVRRLAGRRICRNCQAPYHVTDMPPKVEGKCDLCGGELYQRADDTEETVRNRIRVYTEETSPLIDYYKKDGKLLEVDGAQEAEKVGKDLVDALT